jgi:acetylornithine deacetylase
MPDFRIDREYLYTTLADLVGIDSVNPSLVPGAPGETAAARWTAEAMGRLGLEVETFEETPGRPSVVGRLRGAGGGRSLMLNGHLDTVGVEGMADPFTAVFRDGRAQGRGAFDMKGSLAACLAVVRGLRESGVRLRGDLVLAAVADEEYASLGTAEVARRVRVDGAIVAEATDLDLCLAHKGFVWLEVETLGKAAHGSRFELGIDANLRMGRVLAALEILEQELRARAPHALVGPPSLHAALLRGGSELSTYAARCSLGIERRTIPGETAEQVAAEIAGILERLAAADPSFQAASRVLLAREPLEASPESPLARAAAAAVSRRRGRAPRIIGQPWWTDTALLAAAGAEALLLGPTGGGAHTAEEWVDLQSLEDLAAILADVAVAYCGKAGA